MRIAKRPNHVFFDLDAIEALARIKKKEYWLLQKRNYPPELREQFRTTTLTQFVKLIITQSETTIDQNIREWLATPEAQTQGYLTYPVDAEGGP